MVGKKTEKRSSFAKWFQRIILSSTDDGETTEKNISFVDRDAL